VFCEDWRGFNRAARRSEAAVGCELELDSEGDDGGGSLKKKSE
jgi:hypothetical protein